MAHLTHSTQLEKVRNTKEIRTFKSRGFTFTLNNFSKEEVDMICNSGGYEYVFQEETGKNGTPHLQGGLYYKNAVAFSTVKKLLPRAHIEKCKNWHATKNYCSKGETRTGSIYTNIENFVDKWHSGTLQKKEKWVLTEDWKKNQIAKDIAWHMENDEMDISIWGGEYPWVLE